MKPKMEHSSHNASPSHKEAKFRRSLEELSKDIREIEDFVTVSENIMLREKHLDMEIGKQRKKLIVDKNKENKTPSRCNSAKSPPPTYKISSFKYRRCKSGSPRFLNSKLYFRNGKIGCLDAEKQVSNVESTHALVKHILKWENEKPLVSPDSVRRVLSARKSVDSPPTLAPPHKFADDMIDPPAQIYESTAANCKSNSETTNDRTNEILEYQAAEVELTFKAKTSKYSTPSQEIENLDEIKNYSQADALLKAEEGLRKTKLLQNDIDAITVDKQISSAGSLDSDGQQFLRERVRHLVRRFTARTRKVKTQLELPPTPSSSASSCTQTPHRIPLSNSAEKCMGWGKSVKLPQHAGQQHATCGSMFEADTPRSNIWLCSNHCGGNNDAKTLDPQGKIYISWLCVVSVSFLYNVWVIPLRSTFPFQTAENTNVWFMCDFCSDIIYLLDVVVFKHRLMYLFEGFWVKDEKLARKNYMRKLQFKMDILSLLPLDLLYLKLGTGAVFLRFPRFLKIQSFWEVFKLLDRVISAPHFVRVGKTLTYMLYMIHLTACAYYAYSDYQGLGVNRWVFSGKGHPYVRCFAFATKTATSIGKNPKPEREGEFVFMTCAWLMGVFVFALLIGQIRDIISTATRNRNEYRQLEDETLQYMRRHNLPSEVQQRVKMWFKFTWDQQRTLDEANILDSLPINLKTDIAISVHIKTLSKVQLFADCEEALLRDLVLKLRAVTFLPGDYVCRKGEVGKEMYIVKLGEVQVMGGSDSCEVLATLSEGSVFGEISLLGINGADRRTANVRSKGFSNLFVLSKSDLNEVIVYYPNAKAILKKRARSLMRKNAAREREEARVRRDLTADVVIENPKTPESAPKLLETVIQALPYESPAVLLITKGSRRHKQKRQSEHLETIVDKELKEADHKLFTRSRSFSLTEEKQPISMDLLSSIENELKTKHSINLTDAEKALMYPTQATGQISSEILTCDVEEKQTR